MIDVQKLAREAGLVTDYGAREIASDALLKRFAALVLEEAAKEFDRRMVLDKLGFAIGFYEPDEPAQIVRSLKPKGE